MAPRMDVLNAAEAAVILEIDRSTLARWVKSGRIKATKMPGRTGALVFQRRVVVTLAQKLATENSASESVA